MKKSLVCLFALFFCALHGMEITRDGKAVADIAIPENAVTSVQFAAEEMQKFVKIISGAELEIVKENAPRKFDNRIFLGCGAAPEDKSAFAWRIKADANNLYIHGNDKEIPGEHKTNLHEKLRGWRNGSSGTLLAVYELLDKEFGICFIRPGDQGIVAPARKSIAVASCDKTGKPRWESVGMSTSLPSKKSAWKDYDFSVQFFAEVRLWMFRHGMVETCWFPAKGHAFINYWRWFGESRLDYFALLADGTRRPLVGNDNGRHIPMCISNPKLQDQLIRDWKKRNANAPEEYWHYISVCDNDVPGLCTCPNCRAWDGPNFQATGPYWGDKVVPTSRERFKPFRGPNDAEPLEHSLSDRYCRYYLEMLKKASKSYPNVKVYGHAYANYTNPPQTVKLNDRVVISYAATPMYPMSEVKMAASKKRIQGWADSGCSLEYRPNSTWAYGCMPYQYTDQLCSEYRMVLNMPQLSRVFFDAMRCEFSSQGLMYYTIARLTQHPEKTLEEIADEYFAGFGKAAPQVRQYVAYWKKISDAITDKDEQEWERRSGLELNIFTNGDFSAFVLKPEYFTESAKFLDEAATAADTPQAKENVKYLQIGLEHARMTLKMQIARLENVNHPSPEAKAKFETCLKELLDFRAANENKGISDMGRLTDFERQGFHRSKPLIK